jgi:hypothetical protein
LAFSSGKVAANVAASSIHFRNAARPPNVRWIDQQVSSGRLSAEAQRPDTRLLQHIGATVRRDTHQQIVLHHTNEHLSVAHEAQTAAYNTFLGQPARLSERGPDALRQSFVISH